MQPLKILRRFVMFSCSRDSRKKLFLIGCLVLASCTNQGIYEAIQNDMQIKCMKEPTPSAQENCKEKLIPYKDYEKHRKEK
jgi:hypothetical protein